MTFLRHPIDNLISIYFYWKSSTSASHDLHRRFLVEQPSILRFALYPGIRRLMSASYFGGFDMGRFDFIGFYETRHSDIPRLAGALGLDLLVETHANKTPVSNERHLAETDLVLRQNLKSLLVDDIRFYDRFRDRW